MNFTEKSLYNKFPLELVYIINDCIQPQKYFHREKYKNVLKEIENKNKHKRSHININSIYWFYLSLMLTMFCIFASIVWIIFSIHIIISS